MAPQGYNQQDPYGGILLVNNQAKKGNLKNKMEEESMNLKRFKGFIN